MLSVRRRPRRWNLPACLRVDLLRTRVFSRSLDEVTLTITRDIAPVHAKPTGFTAVRWSQGSTPRKYAAHDTYSSIFPVHKLRQTELTNDGRSKWRLWPLRPAVSCTRDGADWPKVVAVGAQQPISDFFWLYSNARHAINKRRTSPDSWSQELSSHTKINEICQWRPKWRQFKKVVSLAGLHHISKSFQAKKKRIKALWPKMTKIASRGPALRWLWSRGETKRSNIRIKVFVHPCSNFVSLFDLFVPLAHAQNHLRSKKASFSNGRVIS